jgi:hypothetical protein
MANNLPSTRGSSYNIPRFVRGENLLDQLTADRLNALIDAIELNRPQPGVGIVIPARTAGGTVIEAVRHSSGSSDDAHPFKIILKPGSSNNKRYMSVLPGLVDNVMPTLDGDPLWTVPSPTVEITMPQNVPLNVFIQSTIVAGKVTQPTIQTALENDMPEETDSLSTHIIGAINPNGTISQYVKTSLGYQAFAIAFGQDRLVKHVYFRG